uniref:ATP synthase F0 subunit 8 n=1 Tax=Florometra sp. BMK-2020 TaxID=2719553 RepID=A0A6M8TTE8_9ECHI|nr:ATP synthase F0 subunit 8 [Florometra sp. BMK-2020]
MPQLDIFWWGINFFFCWLFFLFVYIFINNFCFLSNGAFSNFSFSSRLSSLWLW